MRYEDKLFTETRVLFADSNFFQVFDFEMIEGDPRTALAEPQTMVLTEDMAVKYFGNESPINKVVTVGDFRSTYKITGVVKNPPHNTHFHFDFLYSMSSMEYSKSDNWLGNSFTTYVVLHDASKMADFNSKMTDLVIKYAGPTFQQALGIDLSKMGDLSNVYGYYLEPMLDIHLHSHRAQAELEPNGDIMYVYLFSAVAVFILVIACINFMNLATARSASRAKEVGIRKTLGSVKGKLVAQFLSESILVTSISFVLALLFCWLAIDGFNELSGKRIEFLSLLTPLNVTLMVALVLLIGLIAGSYPAFYLSAFQPVEVLKGRVRSGVKSGIIRNGLVVFQFTISIALIICTLLVYNQLSYVRSVNIGFDKENVIILPNGNWLGQNADAFRQELLGLPQFKQVSYSNALPPNIQNTTIFRPEGTEEDHLMSAYEVDADHIPTLGMEIVQGRNFSKDNPADSLAVVLSEAAAKELGFAEDPIGKRFTYYNGPEPRLYTVIGVVKNFNYESLRNAIRPIAIFYTQGGRNVAIRTTAGDPQAHLDLVEQAWKKFAPGEPFEYRFLDQEFDQLFRSEQRLGQVFTLFTVLAILIACLGLFGLAAFTAERRTKEIGIRKVMGATTPTIVLLLSQEFTKLILISILIASGIAAYIMSRWLEGFAYRIDISPWVFLGAGGLALAVALITVSYQSIKAALSNPIKSLRSE